FPFFYLLFFILPRKKVDTHTFVSVYFQFTGATVGPPRRAFFSCEAFGLREKPAGLRRKARPARREKGRPARAGERLRSALPHQGALAAPGLPGADGDVIKAHLADDVALGGAQHVV